MSAMSPMNDEVFPVTRYDKSALPSLSSSIVVDKMTSQTARQTMPGDSSHSAPAPERLESGYGSVDYFPRSNPTPHPSSSSNAEDGRRSSSEPFFFLRVGGEDTESVTFSMTDWSDHEDEGPSSAVQVHRPQQLLLVPSISGGREGAGMSGEREGAGMGATAGVKVGSRAKVGAATGYLSDSPSSLRTAKRTSRINREQCTPESPRSSVSPVERSTSPTPTLTSTTTMTSSISRATGGHFLVHRSTSLIATSSRGVSYEEELEERLGNLRVGAQLWRQRALFERRKRLEALEELAAQQRSYQVALEALRDQEDRKYERLKSRARLLVRRCEQLRGERQKIEAKMTAMLAVSARDGWTGTVGRSESAAATDVQEVDMGRPGAVQSTAAGNDKQASERVHKTFKSLQTVHGGCDETVQDPGACDVQKMKMAGSDYIKINPQNQVPGNSRPTKLHESMADQQTFRHNEVKDLEQKNVGIIAQPQNDAPLKSSQPLDFDENGNGWSSYYKTLCEMSLARIELLERLLMSPDGNQSRRPYFTTSPRHIGLHRGVISQLGVTAAARRSISCPTNNVGLLAMCLREQKNCEAKNKKHNIRFASTSTLYK